jgi:phosphate transport system substrate-binding protein
MNGKSLAGLLAAGVLAIQGFGDLCMAQGEADVIKIKGVSIEAGAMDRLGSEFVAANPGLRVVVSGGGTDAGFEALFDKSADIAMTTRRMSEKELQGAAISGVKPAELATKGSCVVIITHPANTVKELTLEQLGKIFSGELTRWKDVGGPDDPILVYTREQVGSTALFLRSAAMDGALFSSDATIRDRYYDIIREVSVKKPWAISYCGIEDARRAAEKKSVKALGIKKDADSPAVFASQQTLNDGTYPLIQPYYLYWNSESKKRTVQKFVEFCKGKL